MIRARTPYGIKTVASVKARTASGLKAAAFVSLRGTTALKRVFSQSGSITVNADPSSVMGAAALAAPTTISTNATTVTASGGAEPYTYAWAKSTDDGGTWSINAPTAATTKFTCSGVGADIDYNATFICTATDAFGGTGTISVPASVSNYGGIYR
ncbi:hypothetical protein [Novosphingobium sp. MMS21-SN21R]|uniref:hypothetical protein n=1 Tax=Novosphingobium sp. MMS21-SN21R TaxID=2969298 RepID=UPI0028855E8E|nr:hypothetical protein [Novosphingobium sp. MMS21-SN21R]MDT0507538.1 hypothetical protein [Novosphingobium sp. MMS21-SN21R]